MRTPITSERDAFWVTVAGLAAVGVAVLVGWLTSVAIGFAVLGAELIVAAAGYLLASPVQRREPLSEAVSEPHPHGRRDGRRHVLVIANETLGGEDLRAHIAGAGGGPVEVDVLAPVLTSHVHYGVSDIDRETAQARRRLERSLEWVRAHGIPARGAIGDPDPVTAIEDRLRDFGADEVIVVTHPPGEATWQERSELQHLRSELDLPITEVVLPAWQASGRSTGSLS